MGIGDLITGMRRKGELFKQYQAEDEASTKVEERKLSAGERMLNKMVRQEREEQIQKELAIRLKREENDYWHKDVISQKNLFTAEAGNKQSGILRWGQ
jgi:hypothetical protein